MTKAKSAVQKAPKAPQPSATAEQPVEPTTSSSEGPETAVLSPSVSADDQPAPIAEKGPETQELTQPVTTESSEPDATVEPDFLTFLKSALDEATDPKEREALAEVCYLVEANPGQDKVFIDLFLDTLIDQLKVHISRPPVMAEEDIVALSFRLTHELSQLEIGTAEYDAKIDEINAAGLSVKEDLEEVQTNSDEERSERIRASATAELDVMRTNSRQRQEAAEAAAADAQRERPKV